MSCPEKVLTHLNEGASIGPRDPHQDLHIRGGESYERWRDDCKQREEAAGGEEGVATVLPQTQTLEVIAECDCNDGEVGA